jgi:hypothetical protein
MRPRLLLLATLLLLSPVSAQSNQVSQTARQALLEMFFGTGADHLEKHLPEVTRNSLKKINSPQGQSVLAEFAMIAAQARTQGTGFETFDTGPTLLTAEDSRGNAMERVEITVERDDLIGEEDQIELALHMTRNGKENRLPFVPRFLFIMKSEKDVWRLNEISVTVRLPLSDPAFLKTIEDQQRAQNEQMTIWMVRQVGTAEKGYLAAQGSYACSLSALGNSGKKPNGKVYLWDPELASGRKNGYNFVISNCDASHYKVVAEPATADTGLRAFCSDESGVLHASQDGKAATCLSRGETVDDGSKAYGLAASGEDPAAHPPKDSDHSQNAPTK